MRPKGKMKTYARRRVSSIIAQPFGVSRTAAGLLHVGPPDANLGPQEGRLGVFGLPRAAVSRCGGTKVAAGDLRGGSRGAVVERARGAFRGRGGKEGQS